MPSRFPLLTRGCAPGGLEGATRAYADSVTFDVTGCGYVGLARELAATQKCSQSHSDGPQVLRRVSQGGGIMRMYELWKMGQSRSARRARLGRRHALYPKGQLGHLHALPSRQSRSPCMPDRPWWRAV